MSMPQAALQERSVCRSSQLLERLAAERGATITSHRDDTRSYYLDAPGEHRVEVIAYPDAPPEDAE